MVVAGKMEVEVRMGDKGLYYAFMWLRGMVQDCWEETVWGC